MPPLEANEHWFRNLAATVPSERVGLRESNGRLPQGPRSAHAVAADEVRRETVSWLEPGLIPLGSVSLLVGDMGLGKSTWTCLVAARLSRGELGPPSVTLMATAEDSLSTTLRPRLEAVEADLTRVRFVQVRHEDGIDEGLLLPNDVDELDRLVAEYGARLVVIDPLMAHLPTAVDSFKDQSVRGALAPLHRLAEAHGCAVLAVAHLNKALSSDPLRRIGGSTAFPAAARSVLLFARDPDDEEGETGRRRVLAHVKCNVAPLAPSVVYDIEPILLPATAEGPEVETSRLRHVGASSHDGRALLAVGGSDEDRSELEGAVAFLREELADGTRRATKEILSAANAIGISRRTLERARKRLGVQSEKDGFGGPWRLWLPASHEGRQGGLAPFGDDEVGVLRSTPHDYAVSDALNTPEIPEDRQSYEVASFDALLGEAER